MPTIHFLLDDGSTRSIEAKAGASVMQTAIHNNVPGIEAECGGSCSCGTCHVIVEDAFLDRLPAPDDMEDGLLEGVAAGRRPGSRLGCQIVLSAQLDGLTVRVPPTQA
jgi:2Fe-2S ferredoxin